MFLDANINFPKDLYNQYEQINSIHIPKIIRMVASVETGKIFGGLKSNKRPKIQARPIAIIKTPAAPINSHRFTPIPINSICKFSLKKSCNYFKLNTPNKLIYQSRYSILIFPSSLTTSCAAN